MNRCSTEEFINKANKKHDNRYEYTKSIYTKTHDKVIITCKVHGDFSQIASNHLRGSNCPECSGTKRMTTESFTDKAHKVHCNKYTYTDTIILNNKDKVVITCPVHGNFEQKPSNHLVGKGCPKCYGNSKFTTNDFIQKSESMHGGKYDYSKVSYTTARSKVTIICPEHGEFQQSAFKHYSGQGCPDCAATGFDPSKPASLYYLSILGGTAYKIGVTNRSIEDRMEKEDSSTYTIVKVWTFEVGQEAYIKEQEVLKTYKTAKYTGDPLLKSGNTEMFSYDILNLEGTC